MFGRIKQFFWRSRARRILLVATAMVGALKTLSLFDAGFAAGLGLLLALCIATVWGLRKIKIGERHAILLFVAVLVTHALFASFIYFADFQPFSGGQGDYGSYHKQAERIAYGFWQGDWSGGGQLAQLNHYYPAILGVVYTLLFPSAIIGQFFNVWVAALALLFLYFIIRELGGSSRWALVTGLIASAYPSFVFYTSLTLKDVLVVLLVLIGLLIALRMMRRFTWREFVLLYVVLLGLTHFRFYMGVIFLGAFVVAWLIASNLERRKRFVYAAIMIPLLGFIPQLTSSAGYFGLKAILYYGSEEQVSFYKEEVYAPVYVVQAQPTVLEVEHPVEGSTPQEDELLPKAEQPVEGSISEGNEPLETKGTDVIVERVGPGSSVDLPLSFESPTAFIKTFVPSFLFVAAGPFPSQFNAPRHYLVLLETIPWYILLLFIGRGAVRSWKTERRGLLLLVFSLGIITFLALFFSNFGITTRIRMPAFLALLAFLPFGFTGYEHWKSRFLHIFKKER